MGGSKLCSDLKATNPGFDSRIDILGRFNCLQLVKLSLTAVDAVDDVIMHFVSKHFTNLVELGARNSSKLTDVGITGQWAGRCKILKFNKSLEELSLKFHVEAFTLLSKLKKANPRRRRRSPHHPTLYHNNHRLMKLWGCRTFRHSYSAVNKEYHYWAHCLHGSGANYAYNSDFDSE